MAWHSDHDITMIIHASPENVLKGEFFFFKFSMYLLVFNVFGSNGQFDMWIKAVKRYGSS